MTHLEKKVRIVKDIFLYGRDDSNKLRDLFVSGESDVELISSSWHDTWKQDNLDLNPLDLTNVNMWSIHEKCSDMYIKFEDGKIIADVRIYDGNFYDGAREELRWEAKFTLGKNSLKTFENQINWKFTSHLDELYEKELEKVKNKRMGEIGKELLKSL